jgi:processive 1,2-diacylglycerol beta-glucosyltransferase
MGGGAGTGLRCEMINALLTQQPRMQLIVLAGRNEALRRSLQEMASDHAGRLHPFGFTDKVHLAMACADLAITKPGGLSTSECLAMGLPMLLVNPIPGQEERNAAYLMQEGVAVRADDPVTLQYRLQRLLFNPQQLAIMRERALALARPDAAEAVLQQVA